MVTGNKSNITTANTIICRVAKLLASLCLIGLAGACMFLPICHEIPGQIPVHAQLALSPDGSRLVVSWNECSGKLHAKLLELNGTHLASIRDLALPADTFTTEFASTNQHLLITTTNGKSSDLLKFDLDKGTAELIYKSPYVMRFPLEVSESNYVFLEGTTAENRLSQWQRLQNGNKSLINPRSYQMAAPLSVVGESLFLLEPWNPPAFRNLSGALPEGLNSLVIANTFSIHCADKQPLTCLRVRLYFDPTHTTMEILSGQRHCQIPGIWKNAQGDVFSRDGNTVAFHAAQKDVDGPRRIYVARQTATGCTTSAFSINNK